MLPSRSGVLAEKTSSASIMICKFENKFMSQKLSMLFVT